jgi:tetratricopeptide (TPR) repeat protein
LQKSLLTYTFILYVLILWGCSAEKTNIASKSFHNTTARYNAYFIAKQRMMEVESAINTSHKNNFNKYLKVFSDVDSSVIRSMDAQLEECIKMSSLAIQRHPNSKWVDDSYVIVGKARYYLADFVNAVETFKYVNTKGEDDDARHEALIWLMRSFIDYNEINNAIAVSDYLKKEELNQENIEFLALTRAYFYQQNEDYDEMLKYLVEIVPELSKKENVSRIYFIIGQVYQDKGMDEEAYEYYYKCMKSNPKYELYFYSKLNLAQVSRLGDQSDIKKIRKYFKKLLRDNKNLEFRDKIYYEMANFEIKQDNYDQGIEYYKSSVASSLRNQRQKGYSYLKLGEIYYDHFRNYEMAKNYYDSTVSVLPDDDDLFESVSARHEILKNFVEQINIIHLQDSLLNLAEMDSISLYAYLDEVIEERHKKAEEEMERMRKSQRGQTYAQTNIYDPFQASNNMTASAATGSMWYFYSSSAISLGQSEFRRIWGDIKLADNWRRANKSQAIPFEDETLEESYTEVVDSLPADDGLSRIMERDNLITTIPFSDEDKAAALVMIENAYYQLGKIYNFDLEEKENAADTYETMLERFAESEYKPEVLYLLYLVYKDLGNEKYEEVGIELVSQFPNTTFAKLVRNPNYTEESDAASEKLKQYYKVAYEYYLTDSLDTATFIINEAMTKFPDNSFSDNMKLLQIMIWGKSDGFYKFQYELQQFEKEYPESELIDFVNHLISSSDNYQEAMNKQNIQYIKYFEQVHFFVLLYPTENQLSDELPEIIDSFNASTFENDDLKTGNIILNDKYSMVLINEFQDMKEAQTYYNMINSEDSPLGDYSTYKLHNFVITKDNFQIFYQTKGLEEYLNFFKMNY